MAWAKYIQRFPKKHFLVNQFDILKVYMPCKTNLELENWHRQKFALA